MIGNWTSNYEKAKDFAGMTPYSLGKLIDWKLGIFRNFNSIGLAGAPYSLGKLIDWKLEFNIQD